MRVHISEKNAKLGRIPNISLPPIVTCVENPPCAKLCYARKAYVRYGKTTTKPAWDENLVFYRESPGMYFASIAEFLEKRKPKRFRWHVGGDIPDPLYLFGMMSMARAFPDIDFLAYSRREYAWRTKTKDSPNITILRSYWLGEPVEEQAGFKVIPKGQAIEAPFIPCVGSCVNCMRCWDLKDGQVVAIHLH